MKGRIVIVTDAWGPKFGGINAFNTDLCIALPKLLEGRYEIICTVLKATVEEVNAASEYGVNLIPLELGPRTNISEEEWVSAILDRTQLSGRPEVVWCVGHDIVSGNIAIEVAKRSQTARACVIHHMNYEAYLPYKETGRKLAQSAIQLQRDVLSRAEIVFAVGPKLAQSARDKVAGRERTRVIELLPGLAEIEGMDPPSKFSAITFGRLNPADDIVKQARLAVAGFARARSANHLEQDATLTLIGLRADDPQGDYQSILALAEKYAQRAVPILAFHYIEDRRELLDYLRRQSLCLMLSIHEGFGLAGWEAIAAEVPLVVSRNSGLFEAIDNLLGGTGTGCLTAIDVLGSMGKEPFKEKDVENVAHAIVEVRRREKRAKQNARFLKAMLSHLCTWRQAALLVADALGLDIPEHPANTRLARWRPEMLLDAFRYSDETVEAVVTRRAIQFERIWDALKAPSRIQRRLIFFGGIATALSDDRAAGRYSRWLIENRSARLYVCYESGPAALARAQRLDEERMNGTGDLPTDPEERMIEKEQRVASLKDRVIERMGTEGEDDKGRIHLIPLRQPLANYIIIADDEVYITPTFQTRSSQTLTFALGRKPGQFNADVSDFVTHHLSELEAGADVDALIQELRSEKLKGD